MIRPWTVLRSTYLLRREWINIRKDAVRLANGSTIPEFHVVEYPDWVGTIAVTEDEHIVLVEQYRHGIGRATLELPAGRVEPDENLQVCAARELLEETGYESADWHEVGRCAPEPAKHSNYAHLFFAGKCRKVSDPVLDAGEDLVVKTFPVDQVLTMVEHGEIVHGIHIAGILWARQLGYLG